MKRMEAARSSAQTAFGSDRCRVSSATAFSHSPRYIYSRPR